MQVVATEGAETSENPGRQTDEDSPRRRCIVTRAVRPRSELLRFVVSPDGEIVPDLAASLPGRGIWVSSRRPVLEKAIAAKAFSRTAKAPVKVGPELVDQVTNLLTRRCLDLIGLARRAGQAVAGFEKVDEAIRSGRAGLLLEASDGAPGGRAKLRAAGRSRSLPVIGLFTGSELGEAFGRDHIVHAAVGGRLAERLQAEAFRLAGFRRAEQDSGAE